MERVFSSFFHNKGKIGSLIEVSRPWNGIVFGLIALLGFLYFSPQMEIITVLSLFFSFIILYMAGTTLNDIFDFHIDKINMPYRPLQSGRLGKKEASIFSGSLYVIAILLSASLGFEVLIIMILLIVLTIFYSFPPIVLSRRSLVANVTLSICTILMPALGGGVLAIKSFFLPFGFWIFFISMTIMFIFITILKDFKDVEGDKKLHKKTFVISVGHKTSFSISIFGTLLFFLLVTYLFYLHILNELFYAISLIIFFSFIYLFLKYKKINDGEKLFSYSRILMLFFIILLLLFLIL
jgi:4-hydroxybenzoate polyprenyltransferase